MDEIDRDAFQAFRDLDVPSPSPSARRALADSHQIARQPGHARVAPEDLLLGIAQELVRQRLLDPELAEMVRGRIPMTVPSESPPGHLPPSATTHRIVKEAREEAHEASDRVHLAKLGLRVLRHPDVRRMLSREDVAALTDALLASA